MASKNANTSAFAMYGDGWDNAEWGLSKREYAAIHLLASLSVQGIKTDTSTMTLVTQSVDALFDALEKKATK